jgi:hypothetical protein
MTLSIPRRLSMKVLRVADILNATIATADLADLAVTTAKINDLAVTTAKIAADAITTAKDPRRQCHARQTRR